MIQNSPSESPARFLPWSFEKIVMTFLLFSTIAVVAVLLFRARQATAASNPKLVNTTIHTVSGETLDDAAIRHRLTAEQYYVAREDGTERPFNNEYWDNHADGIYVDVITGDPLFSSLDKFESGTGWPSFSQPLVKENVMEKTDSSLFMSRTEVRSKPSNSHLGHVFGDGPAPTGQRYCMNSAALRFIPAEKLAAEGYGKYSALFEAKK